MKTIKRLLTIALLFALTAGSQPLAATTGDTPSDHPETVVTGLIEKFDNLETPGGAILVIRDRGVIFSRAFGMANLSYNISFEIGTPTNIGSTSKQFTAFAVALLEEQGKLTVEDDVRKYLPELPDLGDTVRLRHLISHSSGYREYLNSFAMSGRYLTDNIRREEIIPLLQRQPALQNKPGDTYNYNNTGYALLAMVIEKVTEQDFPDWMKENIFEPLGMEHTMVRKNPGEVIPGIAQGYAVIQEGDATAVQDIFASMGAGGIYSTVEDLGRWVQNFYHPVLGNPSIMEKMQTPFLLNSGESANYAYGLLVGELNGLKMVQHGGADIAHRSNLMMFPDIEGAVITQSNNSLFPNQIAAKTAEAFFADAMEITTGGTFAGPDGFNFDPEKFDELAGRFELEVAPGFVLEFTREGEKLFTQATGQPRAEIFASSDSTFYLKIVEASFTFHRNHDGKVDAMTLHQNGHHRASRIETPERELTEEELRMYMGRYYNFELEAFYTLALNQDGKLVLQHRRIPDIPLKAEKQDEYTGAFPISSLKFIRNEQGEVTGFEASSGRSFGIIFNKQPEGN